jgi:abortive infection bacteriophage resistance protein
MAKDPKNIQEQIDLLKSREMSFRDIFKANHFLSNISYYRLKGYWYEMQADFENHIFHENVYFEDVLDLYNFDRHLRLLVFNAIERIEIALRTKLIYHMSISYGAKWYMDEIHFHSKYHFNDFLEKIENDIKQSSEEFIVKHYVNHPDQKPESWKALEVVSLNTLSKLYSNIKPQLPEKSSIANEFGLNSHKDLSSWLRTITFIRNLIAHHSRLWNRVMVNKYSWPNNSRYPLLSYFPNEERRKKFFPIFSAIIYLNEIISPGNKLKDEFLALVNQYPNTPLYKMGFPPKWKEEPIFKNTKSTGNN